MIKGLIFKIIKYLFGIDFQKLLSDNQYLESSNSSIKQINTVLNQQLDLLNVQLHDKEILLNTKIKVIESLQTDFTSAKLEASTVLTDLQELKQKDIALENSNQELSGEIEKLKKELENSISVQHELNKVALKFAEQKKEIFSLREQLALIKGSESELQKLVSNLKDIESKYSDQEKTTSALQEKVASYKENQSIQTESVRNLKEVVSQLQTEANILRSKDEIIQNLKKDLDYRTKQIESLESDIVILRSEHIKSSPPEIIHQEEPSTKILQRVEAIIIEHNGRNIGKRAPKRIEESDNNFDYLGPFLFNLRQFNKQDSTDFPDVFYPKLNTPVLKWHKAKSNTTTGVTEPLLIKSINSLIAYATDIEILTNIALSIRNRDYSYRPDLALFWQKHNLCIDIEIDEPYDIVSLKPLHFIGSSDYLRNLYFNSQGWVVIRFSEEQVNSNTEDCVRYIALVLKIITKESALDSLIGDFKPKFAPRWSYEQAQEFASDKYREKYLNLDTIIDLDPTFTDESPFTGIPPSEDILPEIDYSIIEEKLNNIANRYIRITKYPYEDQLILENYNQEIKNFKKGISGFNLVEEMIEFVPFEIIIDIEGIDSPYKYPLYNNPGSGNDEKLYELVKEAIYNCNPIRMEYRDGKADITFRNIALISYESDSKEHFGDQMWKNYYENKSSMITSFCMLREAQRHFYISRMQAIQIFNMKYFGVGHIMSFMAGLWYPLMKNDFHLCSHIASLIPSYLIETDLTTAGNYAHYLLLSGRKEEALDIYRKYDGQMVTPSHTWREANLQDFQDLKDISDYKEKFDEAIDILGWSDSVISN